MPPSNAVPPSCDGARTGPATGKGTAKDRSHDAGKIGMEYVRPSAEALGGLDPDSSGSVEPNLLR